MTSLRPTDRVFAGAVPELYQRLVVPLIFEPYAIDLAARIVQARPARVLETACGTGVLTRHLARALPNAASIVATDLNPAMIDQARVAGTERPVEWRVADATALPFADASFDLVACQFGVMFFPDRPAGFAEARRVLSRGGRFVFNTWDRLDTSEFTDTVMRSLADSFPADPPRFMARTPHGYFEPDRVESDLRAGGFGGAIAIAAVDLVSRAGSARDVAVGICQGTPLRGEIESRDASRLGEVTQAAERALVARFGEGPIEARMRALVVEAQPD